MCSNILKQLVSMINNSDSPYIRGVYQEKNLVQCFLLMFKNI
ncbi:Uncharacterized protein BM_BM13430 [Brugia malayi]|uniref:Bm13430 n=1 Tax=Brugia malayi TaxID=6279 RepID=A0A0J9YAL4_BRUMA|nr:Uncharacterized protein BM_BM13430 [Brugia malayi]CDQ05884.1 Bm13430 [Brugia malayi]VIP00232.1 Uncharacterized protein BM_BM13430 [Brugia malayi]